VETPAEAIRYEPGDGSDNNPKLETRNSEPETWIQVDRSVRVQIEDVAFGGAGVGRFQGKAVFVPFTIDGETVDARIREEHRGFARAELDSIITPSVHRRASVCPYFGRCGGCDYQHIHYPHQLEIKTWQVQSALLRIGKIANAQVKMTIPSPLEYGFRNRITVHSDGQQIGFFIKGTRRVLDIEGCPIATAVVNSQLKNLRRRPWRHARHVTLREPGSGRTFSQTNDLVAALLRDWVVDHAAGEHIIDAYCGSGFFAKALAAAGRSVTGIEWNAPAIKAARQNARSDEHYLQGDVATLLPDLLSRTAPSTMIADPSASGLSRVVTQALTARPVPRFIYVSCNPATFARDLGTLAEIYQIITVQPFDMFPQTAEIEVAGILEPR
jgi:23S rRNA (uracil1939-C5)-methyltransferase